MTTAVAPDERRTALLIAVPEAQPVVGSFRSRYLADTVARRIPPHVTVLFPFVRAVSPDENGVDLARTHFGGCRPFDAELARVGHFTEFVWLGPEPRAAFLELLAATYERFPEHTPYEGTFAEPEPHLTVGVGSPETPTAEVVEAAQRELSPLLPVRFRVSSVWLYAEQADAGWDPVVELPFAS